MALAAAGLPFVLRAARWLPPPALATAFAGMGIAQGLLRPSRARHAYRWARALEPRMVRRWRLAGSVLASRGLALVWSSLPALESPEAFRHRVTLEGRDHLAAATRQGGTILLGFHALPGVATLALAVHGHRLVPTGMARAFKGWTLAGPSWGPILEDWEACVLWDDERSGASGLARARRLLLSGATVHLAADGPSGREVFRIPLPAGVLVVRAGWWTLRRLTRATTLPVLAHREGCRLVVRVHAPLPNPVDDPGADRAACLAAPAPLIHEQVRRAPEQCAALAGDGWAAADGARLSARAARARGRSARPRAGRADRGWCR
jgi:lauroyl/myristoyl acyltransferase